MQYVHLDCTAPACGWETRLELKARFCLGHFKLSWDGRQLVSYKRPPFLQKRSFWGNHILHLFLYYRQLFVVIAYIGIAAAVVFGWPQANPYLDIHQRKEYKCSTYCCIVICNLWQLFLTWVNKPILKKAATNSQSYNILLSSKSTEETGLLCKFIRSCLNFNRG